MSDELLPIPAKSTFDEKYYLLTTVLYSLKILPYNI